MAQKVIEFGLDRGMPLEPQNPRPILRVILAEKDNKVSIFRDFSWNNFCFHFH